MIPTELETLKAGFYAVPPGHLAAVVTLFERSSPFTGGVTPRPDLRLDRHERPKLDWYRRLFCLVGAPWLWTSRLALSEEALQAQIHDPDIAIFSLEPASGGQESIGMLELDFRQCGACEISLLGLVKEWAGR